MIDTALENTTTMTMSADSDAVLADFVEDELCVLSTEAIETFLDDVIAVQVLDQLYNSVAQSLDDRVDLGMSTSRPREEA